MPCKGTSESQLPPAYVEQTKRWRSTKLDPASQPRKRSNSQRQKHMQRGTNDSRTIKYANPPATSRFMASRSGHGRRRHTRTCNERPRQERGFSEHLNPSAWVRAVHKFNSVIVTTQFQSMHTPVSIRTSKTMADIKALVDSGATDCFMSENFIRRMKLGKRPLQKSRKIWNIDNTANQAREIM